MLKMGMNKELKGMSIKQKLAMNYVSKESKGMEDVSIFLNGPSVKYEDYDSDLRITTSWTTI